jgi:large subunit ribosomal protein L33
VAKKSEARVTINLACTECQNRNYTSSKNKRNDTQRLELNKFCPFDRKVTLHRETK